MRKKQIFAGVLALTVLTAPAAQTASVYAEDIQQTEGVSNNQKPATHVEDTKTPAGDQKKETEKAPDDWITEGDVQIKVSGKTMIIKGTGVLKGKFEIPKTVQNVIVEEGFTEIGKEAFKGESTLENVQLPEGLFY